MIMCDRHQDYQYSKYCISEKQLVCEQCLQTPIHTRCQIWDLFEAYEYEKDNYNQSTKLVPPIKQKLEKDYLHIQNQQDHLQINYQMKLDSIDKYFDTIREVLDKGQKELKSFLQKETQKQINTLDQKKKENMDKLQWMDEFINFNNDDSIVELEFLSQVGAKYMMLQKIVQQNEQVGNVDWNRLQLDSGLLFDYLFRKQRMKLGLYQEKRLRLPSNIKTGSKIQIDEQSIFAEQDLRVLFGLQKDSKSNNNTNNNDNDKSKSKSKSRSISNASQNRNIVKQQGPVNSRNNSQSNNRYNNQKDTKKVISRNNSQTNMNRTNSQTSINRNNSQTKILNRNNSQTKILNRNNSQSNVNRINNSQNRLINNSRNSSLNNSRNNSRNSSLVRNNKLTNNKDDSTKKTKYMYQKYEQQNNKQVDKKKVNEQYTMVRRDSQKKEKGKNSNNDKEMLGVYESKNSLNGWSDIFENNINSHTSYIKQFQSPQQFEEVKRDRVDSRNDKKVRISQEKMKQMIKNNSKEKIVDRSSRQKTGLMQQIKGFQKKESQQTNQSISQSTELKTSYQQSKNSQLLGNSLQTQDNNNSIFEQSQLVERMPAHQLQELEQQDDDMNMSLADYYENMIRNPVYLSKQS